MPVAEAVVGAVAVAYARSVGSAPRRQATAAAGSVWSAHLRGCAAGGIVEAAAPDASEAVAGVSPGRADDYPCRANQAARGVGAESFARFCLMRSVPADIVGVRIPRVPNSASLHADPA